MPEDQAALHGGYKRGVTGGRATSANKSSSAALAGSGLGASGGLGDGNKCLRMRVAGCLFYALFERESVIRGGIQRIGQQTGPAAWEIQLSSRLFSLFASHPPCL